MNINYMKKFLAVGALLIGTISLSGCAKSSEVISTEDNIVVENQDKDIDQEIKSSESTTTQGSNSKGINTEKTDTEIDDGDELKDDNKANVNSEESSNKELEEVVDVMEVIDYNDVKPNEVGDIIVVMYHGIQDNPPYHRTYENFIKDLQYMYDNNYRLISVTDFIENNIDVEAGYTPIVLTFDDGLASTFSLEEVDGELVPKAGTAIAAIEAFTKEHPDFGKTAALYLNGGLENTFKGAGTYEERLNWLIDNGYELGNHLYSHPFLNQLDSDEIQMEIGKVDQQISNAVENYEVTSITYPYGIMPEESYQSYIESGSYKGEEYTTFVAFREAFRNKLVPSIHVDFDPYNCSRVRGNEGEFGEVWWAFEMYENNPSKKYVSDGDPDVIVVPEDNLELVNLDALNGKEIITY